MGEVCSLTELHRLCFSPDVILRTVLALGLAGVVVSVAVSSFPA